jgi:hypothetical protein
MDADEVAVLIANLLYEAGWKFKFKAEGDRIGSNCRSIVWSSVVVEAEHPKSGELFRLYTLDDARKLVGSFPR